MLITKCLIYVLGIQSFSTSWSWHDSSHMVSIRHNSNNLSSAKINQSFAHWTHFLADYSQVYWTSTEILYIFNFDLRRRWRHIHSREYNRFGYIYSEWNFQKISNWKNDIDICICFYLLCKIKDKQ